MANKLRTQLTVTTYLIVVPIHLFVKIVTSQGNTVCSGITDTNSNTQVHAGVRLHTVALTVLPNEPNYNNMQMKATDLRDTCLYCVFLLPQNTHLWYYSLNETININLECFAWEQCYQVSRQVTLFRSSISIILAFHNPMSLYITGHDTYSYQF